MTRPRYRLAGAGRHSAATVFFWIPLFSGMTLGVNMAMADMPNVDRQRELTRFVRQECGFCHGLKLTGGLGSPLTAEALKEKPAEALVATILQGRPGTAMPPWSPHLSETDASWIVERLQKGFPDEAR